MKETELSSNTKTADGKWQFVFHNTYAFDITMAITVGGKQADMFVIPAGKDYPYQTKIKDIHCAATSSADEQLAVMSQSNGEVCFHKYGGTT